MIGHIRKKHTKYEPKFFTNHKKKDYGGKRLKKPYACNECGDSFKGRHALDGKLMQKRLCHF